MKCPIVTLTTDFGLTDSYVAQMKGALLSINPQVVLVDVTHQIPPQNIVSAAIILDDTMVAFPAGTIHVVVVDPGVGSDRAILAVEISEQKVICPDNGILSRVLQHRDADRVTSVTNREFFRTKTSATFHGRDIMAPVAAHWSLGVDAASFGSELPQPPVRLPLDKPEITEEGLLGQIIHVDSFGNAITNITMRDLPRHAEASAAVRAGSSDWLPVAITYASVAEQQPLALIGSSGHLEVAVNRGHATNAMGLHVGDRVVVRLGDNNRQ